MSRLSKRLDSQFERTERRERSLVTVDDYSVGPLVQLPSAHTRIHLATKGGSTVLLRLVESSCTPRKRRRMETAVECLKMVQHRNVLRLLEHSADLTTVMHHSSDSERRDSSASTLPDSYSCSVSAFELAPNGELFSYVAYMSGLPLNLVHSFFHQLIDGLEAIHGFGLAHSSLRPECLLLDRDFVLKIVDFSGHLRGVSSSSRRKTTASSGDTPESDTSEVRSIPDVSVLSISPMAIVVESETEIAAGGLGITPVGTVSSVSSATSLDHGSVSLSMFASTSSVVSLLPSALYDSSSGDEESGSISRFQASDMFQAGFILFYMLAGVPPFSQTDRTDWWWTQLKNGWDERANGRMEDPLAARSKHGAFWASHHEIQGESCPLDFKDVVLKLMHPEWSERPSIEQLRTQPWSFFAMPMRVYGRSERADKRADKEFMKSRCIQSVDSEGRKVFDSHSWFTDESPLSNEEVSQILHEICEARMTDQSKKSKVTQNYLESKLRLSIQKTREIVHTRSEYLMVISMEPHIHELQCEDNFDQFIQSTADSTLLFVATPFYFFTRLRPVFVFAAFKYLCESLGSVTLTCTGEHCQMTLKVRLSKESIIKLFSDPSSGGVSADSSPVLSSVKARTGCVRSKTPSGRASMFSLNGGSLSLTKKKKKKSSGSAMMSRYSKSSSQSPSVSPSGKPIMSDRVKLEKRKTSKPKEVTPPGKVSVVRLSSIGSAPIYGDASASSSHSRSVTVTMVSGLGVGPGKVVSPRTVTATSVPVSPSKSKALSPGKMSMKPRESGKRDFSTLPSASVTFSVTQYEYHGSEDDGVYMVCCRPLSGGYHKFGAVMNHLFSTNEFYQMVFLRGMDEDLDSDMPGATSMISETSELDSMDSWEARDIGFLEP